MNFEQTENELIIRETPGCLWIFGLFFAFVGGVFVYGALGGLTDWERHEAWMLALTFVMGAIGVGMGIWIIHNAPITKIVINRKENTVLMSRFGLLTRQDFLYDFDEIEGFCLSEDIDSEGDPIWYFALKLNTREIVKITALARHSYTYESEYVFRANEFMHKQIPASQMIFAADDEVENEMS